MSKTENNSNALNTLNTDTEEDFNKWYSKFVSKHGGFTPQIMKKWLERVNSSHKSLREKLGGIRFRKQYRISSTQKPLPQDLVDKYYTAFEVLFAGSEKTFPKEARELISFPTFSERNNDVRKTSKWLSDLGRYIDNRDKNDEYFELISRLGEEWAKLRCEDKSYRVIITTAPRAFAILGHLGPDAGSCFSQGGSRANNKYALGQTTDSFICIVYSDDENARKDAAIYRSLGFLKGETLNFFNGYLKSGIQEGDILSLLEQVSKDVLKSNTIHTSINVNHIDGDVIYHNGYARWTFSTINPPKSKECVLTIDLRHVMVYECDLCQKTYSNGVLVDDKIVCEYCLSKAYKCELTNIKTFEPLLEFYYESDGLPRVINVCKAVFKDIVAKPCQNCGIFHSDKNNLIVAKNVSACKICIDDIEICEICTEYCEDCHNLDDQAICNDCFTPENIVSLML